MKTIIAVVLFAMVMSANAEKGTVTPKIAPRFGEVITIEAEFVEKPNSYHAQNFVKEPFLISVVAVNGQSLSKPIVMEYSASSKEPVFKKGVRYTLEAYETIYTLGDPKGWNKLASQVDYHIVHRIVIRSPNK